MDDWNEVDWGADPEENAKKYKSDHTIDEQVLKARAIKRRIKNDTMATVMMDDLNKLCGEPKPGEQWRIVTEKQFNAFALISHIIKNRVIEEMCLAVYRINEPTVDAIIEAIEAGRIRKATFIISSFFNQTKKPEAWAIKLREYAKEHANCQHVYTHNHSKVLAVRTADGDHFVFEGSGNMSDNARIEQYLYENCEETYGFHRKWMVELADTGGTKAATRKRK